MTAKIIAFSGAHGTGKTTAVFREAARIKCRKGLNVGVVQETARRCPYPILSAEDVPVAEAQEWIFAEQMRCELVAMRMYDVVVSDRSIVDCIAYSSACGFHGLVFGQLALARTYMHHYKEIRFHGTGELGEFNYLVPDGTRNTDPKLQKEVQAVMLELYAKLGVKITRVQAGDVL